MVSVASALQFFRLVQIHNIGQSRSSFCRFLRVIVCVAMKLVRLCVQCFRLFRLHFCDYWRVHLIASCLVVASVTLCTDVVLYILFSIPCDGVHRCVYYFQQTWDLLGVIYLAMPSPCMLMQSLTRLVCQQRRFVWARIAVLVGPFRKSIIYIGTGLSRVLRSFSYVGRPTVADLDCRSFAALALASFGLELRWPGLWWYGQGADETVPG